MKSAVSYLKGYVTICFRSEKPERFLNLCAHHGILIEDLVQTDDGCHCRIPAGDFKKLKSICRKTHTKVRITGKYGLPFFFYRNKKRKAFFIGIFLALGLIGFLSTRVWNIHIEGNYSNSTQVILRFLEEKEIRHGIAKKDVNCAQIAAWIRKEYTDVTWVSARLLGTRLLITIQENDITAGQMEKASPAPCDLVAEKSGQIVQMITRQGIPAVGVGAEVKKGETLVKGQIPIVNDAQEIIRYEYVCADADVYLSYRVQYKETFPLRYQKRVYTGNTRTQYYVQILNHRISLGIPFTGFETYDSVSSSHLVYLTENFRLPVSYGKTTEMEYGLREEFLTREEAFARADRKLNTYLEQLLEDGVQIYQNTIETTVTDSECVTSGSLLLVENAVEEKGLTDLEQLQITAVPEESQPSWNTADAVEEQKNR